ncbi:unnamed protein product [Adineta ricciae]|uniref:F-box domain-containing protein n=1 Tax=Adineta ricciae TaxID=249248 RepID=A0A814HCS0_ADIRI|nr:unnamed protein product [Adineta ricciae]
MSQRNVHLLDLPNEILFIILKKLPNIDVLYSLFGINNQRLNLIAQEDVFIRNLHFVRTSQSTDEVHSMPDAILNRFCHLILPKIHENIKSLTIESVSMENILNSGIYPNLTKLTILNFNEQVISYYLNDNSPCAHIYRLPITDLILIINEKSVIDGNEFENINVDYGIILTLFKHLKHLSIKPISIFDYPPLSLCNSSSMTCSSSILTKLCINVHSFNDCLALLDGRLKQLTSFNVQINYIGNRISRSYNMDDLPNLHCFSLICYNDTTGFQNLVVPLLRRMSYLKELTIYIQICHTFLFVSGHYLDNEILNRMFQLQIFKFYFASQTNTHDLSIRLSNEDIEKTFTNKGQRHMTSMVDYIDSMGMISRVFSIPFQFTRLRDITNNLPTTVYDSVTHLKLSDEKPFNYEFFYRLARIFPSVRSLCIWNLLSPFSTYREYCSKDEHWCSMIEYSQLISLDISFTHIHYVEQFLNETKVCLPRLTELKVKHRHLRTVTDNFTRDVTRRNYSDLISHSILTNGLKKKFQNLQIISEEKDSINDEQFKIIQKKFNVKDKLTTIPQITNENHFLTVPLSSVAVWIDPLDATKELNRFIVTKMHQYFPQEYEYM